MELLLWKLLSYDNQNFKEGSCTKEVFLLILFGILLWTCCQKWYERSLQLQWTFGYKDMEFPQLICCIDSFTIASAAKAKLLMDSYFNGEKKTLFEKCIAQMEKVMK